MRRAVLAVTRSPVEETFDDVQHTARVGVEVFVDRGTDDDDHVLCLGNGTRFVRNRQPVGSDQPLEQLVGSALEERHLSRPDPINGECVAVVERDRQAGVSERKTEGVAATAP